MLYHGNAMDYIYETPDILQYILENKKEILEDSNRVLKDKKISEIYLTGSGSSYNAAVAVADFAKKLLGIRVTPVYPVMLIEDYEFISKSAVVTGISQQGTSAAVIKALDDVRERGIATISMTGEYDTEITRHADANIYIECGYEDAGATTKGFTATVLTLMIWIIDTAESIGRITEKETENYKRRIDVVIKNMKNILQISKLWCSEISEKLKDNEDMILISGNKMRSLLLEGILKFSETCRFPVRGYEAEEFMHGMYNAVTSKTNFLYIFPPNGYERNRMEKLFDYYTKQGYCLFGINSKQVDENIKYILNCKFTDDPEFSILEYILPVQMLFVMTSRARKIDLNIPSDPDFHRYMGSKLEK